MAPCISVSTHTGRIVLAAATFTRSAQGRRRLARPASRSQGGASLSLPALALSRDTAFPAPRAAFLVQADKPRAAVFFVAPVALVGGQRANASTTGQWFALLARTAGAVL